jgi:hypothetical protein
MERDTARLRAPQKTGGPSVHPVDPRYGVSHKDYLPAFGGSSHLTCELRIIRFLGVVEMKLTPGTRRVLGKLSQKG